MTKSIKILLLFIAIILSISYIVVLSELLGFWNTAVAIIFCLAFSYALAKFAAWVLF